MLPGSFNHTSTLPVERGGDGNRADMMFISTIEVEEHGLSFYECLLTHEFQHLVNYNRHGLVREARFMGATM